MRAILAFVLLSLAAPVLAQDYADVALSDPKKEAEAVALMDLLRCVVCQGQPMNYDMIFDKAIDRLHTEGRYRVFIDILRNKGNFPNARCFAGMAHAVVASPNAMRW
ncbi:MAG: cytochrome c-type biogenesis protein CcmH [Sphingorhabdus sp.]